MKKINNSNGKIRVRKTFWIKVPNYKNKKDDLHLNKPKLREYLKDEGYLNYRGEAIKITGNIAEKVTPKDIFIHCLKYVETFNQPALESLFLTKGETVLLKNKAIILSLSECSKLPLKDNENISYKCYKQGILVVEKDKEFKFISYEKAPGFIWKNAIIDREFRLMSDKELMEGDFFTFVTKITNNENHFDSVCTALGYLLHGYKDQRKPIAILINDENIIDEGKPEGGSGKGLLVKAVSQIVEKAIYNGKNADFTKDKFAYQNVVETTRILFIDDVPRNFNFESLFSALTDDLPIEKKHQQAKVMPFEDSPKFVITTNYTINGNSSSYKRRRFDIFLNNYYSDEHTPTDDFGKEFFHGWSVNEWQLFDYFMMSCLRLFLSLGLKRYDDKSWDLKMLKNETSSDFVELMDEKYNQRMFQYEYSSVRHDLVMKYGEKYYFLNKDYKIIVQWVSRYASFKGITLVKGRKTKGISFTFQS